MNEAHRDAPYWRNLRKALEAFVGAGSIERYLFNAADFEELANLIFDDLDAKRRFGNLPDKFAELRSRGVEYIDFLGYLIGPNFSILRDAPVYNAGERDALFCKTDALLTQIDALIGDLEST